MAAKKLDGGWVLVPSTTREIEFVRRRCRKLVLRRAAVSAGAAALPLPGLDTLVDLGLFANLASEINTEFGFSPEQIGRLRPVISRSLYESIAALSLAKLAQSLAGAALTHVANRTAAPLLAKQSAKLVPVAGQLVSAALGFTVFRSIGYQHVESCALVAQELMRLEIKPAV